MDPLKPYVIPLDEASKISVGWIGGKSAKLSNQDWVTVDGFLGIVTVGEPEFDLQLPLHIPK